MKKRILPWLQAALCIFLLSGCVATSGITTTHAITASGPQPGRYTTYSWYQEQPQQDPDFIKDFDKGLDEHIRKAIEEELQKKGLRKTSGNPDVLVAYDVSVSVPKEKDIAANFADGFGYSYAHMAGYRYNYQSAGIPGYRAVDLFKQGTFIIDLVDPASSQLLWRGWTEGAISNFNAGYKKIHRQVEAILAKEFR
ncbi:DUF4136 domain-containing protein [Pontibacter qinzhouensis]|uniref:DUF4136 domain-containing protein n=1 Tax=Pontibacter qinzhouensis TaxID=2603253 RepID=A0A5C8K681_9BACT|nr:DUF4136 domain-containing protein [Pontibacter qinzhouensis]TXK46948.1 DUF4136 domain-containing protein [Pontibacter qinzhouensis]